MAKNKDPEVFNISFLDLISGGLGVMSILFFMMIPDVSSLGSINPEEHDNLKGKKEEFIYFHVLFFHKSLNSITIEDSNIPKKYDLKSDYFINKDTALFKYTALYKDVDLNTINIKFTGINKDTIYSGSEIWFLHPKDSLIRLSIPDSILNQNFEFKVGEVIPI